MKLENSKISLGSLDYPNQIDLLNKIGDFYLVRDFEKAYELPEFLFLEGKKHFRHMGFMYLPEKPENLTPGQIIELNNIRKEHFNTLVDRGYVEQIYSYVYNLMRHNLSSDQKSKGIRVLDFGAGTGSFVHHIRYSGIDGHFPMNFLGVDINPNYKDAVEGLYQSYLTISPESEIPFGANYFDVVVALFVFHYSVPNIQVNSIRKILSEEGLLIFNLYRPSPAHRRDVLSSLELLGLQWERRDFNSKQLYHGMKHAPTEFYLCRKR